MLSRVGRVIFAVVIFVVSLPLTRYAMERGFGLAAGLTVPTCCVGFGLSIVSARRAHRIGWFAFSSVCVFLLPMGPWWQQGTEYVLRWVQSLLRGPRSTFLYSGAETAALLVLILLPCGVGCTFGLLAARLARFLFHDPIHNDVNQKRPEYRFTLRGMFLAIMICAALTAWITSTLRQWETREVVNQQVFLQRFARSFTSGNVTLLAEPEIAEDHSVIKRSQNSSGISEYRVIAPIGKTGGELWAVWTYLCDDRYPDTVSKFGYAEAATRSSLPLQPFPITEYLRDPIDTMIDGEPQTTTRVEVINAPTVASPGDTIAIIAQTDGFLECDLVIRPFQAIASPPPKIIAPQSGLVRWYIRLDPAFRGSRIEYEFQARTNMAYRAKTVTGVITLDTSHGDEPSDARPSSPQPVVPENSSPY